MGASAAGLIDTATMWPQGCDAAMQLVQASPTLVALFGGKPQAGWTWDGAIEPTRINVHIPISGPCAKGVAVAAVLKTDDGWDVVACLVHITEASTAGVKALLEQARPSPLSKRGQELPRDPERYAGLAFDVVSNRWLLGMHSFDVAGASAASPAGNPHSVAQHLRQHGAASAAQPPARS